MKKWEWKKLDEGTWVCGTRQTGLGVFLDEGQGWGANVVTDGGICAMPYQSTREEAMAEAEKYFEEIYEEC